jgi:hypothetical protein
MLQGVTYRRVSGEILVRVVPPPGEEGNLSGGAMVDQFAQRVDELGHSITEIAAQLRRRLETELAEQAPSAWQLNEIGLSFSLDLQAETGVVVAKAKTAAGFEVTLNWTRGSPPG